MRMLIHAKIPHDPFNGMVRNGTAGKVIGKILEEIKPEAAYFTEYDGKRGCIMIVDVADPSKVPGLAEPFFLSFNADVTFHIVMSGEDLGRAGLDAIGKKWA
jgi:hypothetical protein